MRRPGRANELLRVLPILPCVEQLEAVDDHGQEVVEVVRYAAGQSPHRVEALGVLETVLCLAPGARFVLQPACPLRHALLEACAGLLELSDELLVGEAQRVALLQRAVRRATDPGEERGKQTQHERHADVELVADDGKAQDQWDHRGNEEGVERGQVARDAAGRAGAHAPDDESKHHLGRLVIHGEDQRGAEAPNQTRDK